MDEKNLTPGKPYPFGISQQENITNFSLVSLHAEKISLCLFNRATKALIDEILLSPQENKTGSCWHIGIKDLEENLLYMYKIIPSFQKPSLLLDPYATSVCTPTTWDEPASYIPYGNVGIAPYFDWEGDISPNLAMNDLIIYEMHVRGFTQDESSHVKNKGTFLGVIEKIPHLVNLGINAVELLPIQEFNEKEYIPHYKVNHPLYNYWGYSTVNFFSLMNRYASENTPFSAVNDFKTMVKALHKANIEVILDVVFNHTAEGNEKGPIYSFKGIDNSVYYMTDALQYLNFSGCGNTVNCNHPIVIEMIINVLRYLTVELHVDGFRFDLAAILNRDTKGNPQSLSPLIQAISSDPILKNVKLLAEPWDATGLYQVGNFAEKLIRWSEWNDKYRDDVRRFIKGCPSSQAEFARRLFGSQDLYYDKSCESSLNYITSHDGFTLRDLVSYQTKHNLENGENNKDGSNHNESCNNGFEGATNDKAIAHLRWRQMKNFILALMLSQGIPMILMGDEYGHTKNGNNNSWCQDNKTNWFQWDKLLKNTQFYRFYKSVINFRKTHPILKRQKFLTDQDIDWHGTSPFKPDWESETPFMAYTLKEAVNNNDLYVAFNADSKPKTVQIPPSREGRDWQWVVNTANDLSNESLSDFYDEGKGPILGDRFITMEPHSAILLKQT